MNIRTAKIKETKPTTSENATREHVTFPAAEIKGSVPLPSGSGRRKRSRADSGGQQPPGEPPPRDGPECHTRAGRCRRGRGEPGGSPAPHRAVPCKGCALGLRGAGSALGQRRAAARGRAHPAGLGASLRPPSPQPRTTAAFKRQAKFRGGKRMYGPAATSAGPLRAFAGMFLGKPDDVRDGSSFPGAAAPPAAARGARSSRLSPAVPWAASRGVNTARAKPEEEKRNGAAAPNRRPAPHHYQAAPAPLRSLRGSRCTPAPTLRPGPVPCRAGSPGAHLAGAGKAALAAAPAAAGAGSGAGGVL